MRTEYEDFRREIVTKLGITISNSATAEANPQVSTEVLTNVEQMTEVVTHVEVSVREELRNLASELANASAGQGAELGQEAERLAQDPDKGTSFLDKAKRFTEKVKDVLTNTEGATGAVLSTVATLGKLLGLAALVL